MKRKQTIIYRLFSACLSIVLAVSFVIPAHAQSVLNLPAPGTMILPSPSFNPAIIKGITIHPNDPFLFDFIVHPGDEKLKGDDLTNESNKLIKYFMAALTVPEDEMWVNLSPYEKDRIIPKGFGNTEMGRDLLAQDYMLKQLTASLMYPEDELGNDFWARIYEKAQEKYGTTEIPMNTFNKVWIVPEKAVIYENGTSAFIVETYLKVMLEEDYLALESNMGSDKYGLGDISKDDLTQTSEVSSEIIKEIIIPAIEKEVNEGKTFANLRQISNSVILATWYKQNVQGSILEQIYINKNRTGGIDIADKEINQKIYDQYVVAFKKGVYDFIKEDYDEVTQAIIPRKYFSGGAEVDWRGKIDESGDSAQLGEDLEGAFRVRMRMGDQAMMSSPITEEVHAILPEQSEYYPLDERAYTSSEDDYATERPVEREKQIEHSSQGVNETRRYSELFANLDRWPHSSLEREKILAQWIDKMISLKGKRVVQYRPEYYPFFGIAAAKHGAVSHLVNVGQAPFAEDFLLGKKGRVSFQDYQTAMGASRQISPFGEAVSQYSEELLKLPPQMVLEIIVREKNNINEEIWDGLTLLEKQYYILLWVKDNPGFSLKAANYFSNQIQSERGASGGKSRWLSLNSEERLPYLLDFFAENLSQLLKEEVHSAALSILRRQSIEVLTDEQKYALYIGGIYGQNGLLEGNDILSEDGLRDKTVADSLNFHSGRELEDIDLPESSVDVIFSAYALNFVEDSVKFANGVTKLLKPGGIFLGYLKIDAESLRSFKSVEDIRIVLNRLGFSNNNILIIEEVEEDGRGDPHYLFFAKKSEDVSSLTDEIQKSLPWVTGTEQSLVQVGASLDIRSSEVVSVSDEFEPIKKDWEEVQTLSSLSERIANINREEPSRGRTIIDSLHSLVFGEGVILEDADREQIFENRTNLDNLVRQLIVRHREFSDLEEAVASQASLNGLNFILDDLRQFYLARRQVNTLLHELADIFKRGNLFLPTEELQSNILERAKVIGGEELSGVISNILDTVNNPGIPWRERQSQIFKAQSRLMKYVHDYNYFIYIEFVVSPIFYSKHEHPDGPPDNNAYEVKASIGDVVEVSEVRLNGSTYFVDKVNRNISVNREVRGQFMDFGDKQKHFLVYIDSFRDWFEKVKKEYRRRGVWGALVKRQWGDTLPSDEEILMSEVESIAIHEIIHDLFPRLGELPSYLTQIAFGPQPFVDLFHRLMSLSEIGQGDDLMYIVNLINPDDRSEHYKASMEIVTAYLRYALEHNKIAISKLQGLIESLIVSKPDGFVLDESKLLSNRDAIIAAVSLLSEEEIRTIARDWLNNKFDFELTTRPQEVTLSLPMPEDILEDTSGRVTSVPALENKRVLQTLLESFEMDSKLPVPTTGETLPEVLAPTLESSLAISDFVKRADSITQLAILTASWNTDSAADLIRNSIKQNFPRAKALLHLATSLEAVGNKEKAIELLREAESILSESDRRIQPYLPDQSGKSFNYFLFEEILALKQRLGLTEEVQRDIVSLDGGVVQVVSNVKDLQSKDYEYLIQIAVRTNNRTRLDQISQAVQIKDEDGWYQTESRLVVLIQLGLAYSRLGNKDKAYEMIKKVIDYKIFWNSATHIVKAALSLATIGHPKEADEKMDELKSLKDVHNRVGVVHDYLYVISGRIKLLNGDVSGAREDFMQALNMSTEGRSAEDDYVPLSLIDVMIDHNEFLSDAIQITDNIRNHEKRANALITLAITHYNIGQVEQVEELLSAALKIAENIEDDARHELMKFRIYTIRTKIQAGDKIGEAFDSLSSKRESDFPGWFSGDSAMLSKASSPGGIDFNPQNINIQMRGDGIKIQFPIFKQDLPFNTIDGFVPIIINIVPITNIPALLGQAEKLNDPTMTISLN